MTVPAQSTPVGTGTNAAADTRPTRTGAALTHSSDLLGIEALSGETIASIIDGALAIKAAYIKGQASPAHPLAGKSVTMLFEKPSLRTRMSFEIGLTRLGAHVVYFDHSSQRLGERESIKDYAKNLERWTDCLIARVHDHAALEQLAKHASIPVVNALSDLEHPCQALADVLTVREHFGSLDGLGVAFLGDGNNVCHSLMLACVKLGVSFTAITASGHEPAPRFVDAARAAAAESGASVTITGDLDAIEGHAVVYTDTWVSMGEGGDADAKRAALRRLQVNRELMTRAARGTGRDTNHGKGREPIFMHCLPAHRGQEVTDDVIDSACSVVYDQAENRMHAQSALVTRLLGSGFHPTAQRPGTKESV